MLCTKFLVIYIHQEKSDYVGFDHNFDEAIILKDNKNDYEPLLV